MAFAHHDATGGDQRCGCEAEFVGTQQRADNDIAAGAQPAIDLNGDAERSLLRTGSDGSRQDPFPTGAGMFDRGEGAGAGAAFHAGDRDMIGARLGDARSNGADTDFGDEFDGDIGTRIDVFQIVNELRQILDRIDVMVRRRGDEADPGVEWRTLAMTASTLWPGNCPPSPGLAPCAILIWIMSELTRYSVVTPKRPGRHLLDRRAAPLHRRSVRLPRRLRRCWTCRRCGSSP